MSRLKGKVCVITGASSGIGAATTRALARAGATVVLAARREDLLEALGTEIRDRGATASWMRTDVRSEEDVRALRDHVLKEHGRCDVLVNNAGVPGGGSFADLSIERMRVVTETNYVAVLVCTKVFLDPLLETHGHVVNVASLAGRYALPGASVYAASKHAVVAFSESLHFELKPRGVMVTVVNPGLVVTEGFFPKGSRILTDPLTKPFLMKPERVARAIVEVIRDRRGPEVSVPRWLGAPQAARLLAPPLYRAALKHFVSSRAGSAQAPAEEPTSG